MSGTDFLIAGAIAAGAIIVGGIVWTLVRAGDDDIEEGKDDD